MRTRRPAAASLKGRTALVTGASRGRGRAIALRLAREGAAVGVNYREQADAAEGVAREIRTHGGRALPVGADVGDAAQVEDMVSRVTSELGGIDTCRLGPDSSLPRSSPWTEGA